MNRKLRIVAALLAATSLWATSASAAGKPAAGDAAGTPSDESRWRSECGACHVAYAPRLLSGAAWSAIVASLDRHFGTDASLDAPARDAVLRYLSARSGSGRAPAGAAPRITESGWFKEEHGELPASVWKRPSVRSPANCGACHGDAEKGRFDEASVRIPK